MTDRQGDEPVLTEEELVAAFIRTFGMAPGHAAGLAAWHVGRPHRCLVQREGAAPLLELSRPGGRQ